MNVSLAVFFVNKAFFPPVEISAQEKLISKALERKLFSKALERILFEEANKLGKKLGMKTEMETKLLLKSTLSPFKDDQLKSVNVSIVLIYEGVTSKNMHVKTHKTELGIWKICYTTIGDRNNSFSIPLIGQVDSSFVLKSKNLSQSIATTSSCFKFEKKIDDWRPVKKEERDANLGDLRTGKR